MAISTSAWNLLYLLLLPSAVMAEPQPAHVADSEFFLGQRVTALGTPEGDYIYVPITYGKLRVQTRLFSTLTVLRLRRVRTYCTA
jgi:hypothetical protein